MGMIPLLRFNLCLAALGTFAAFFFRPCSASAKLGEDLPALVKRFGSNYRPVKPGRWADAAYKFESKNCQVEVAFKAGHSVAEYYFCYQPLVNGKPPASIWQGIRLKNAPGVKWKPDGHGGLVSADGHFTTWFSTESLPEQSTCAIGINDYYSLKEGQLAAVAGQANETSQVATAQPAGKPALPVVGGVEFHPVAKLRLGDYAGGNFDSTKYVYSYQYFRIAESSQAKQVYAARNYSKADCKVYDYPGNFVSIEEGEPLRVISVDPETYSLSVLRLRFNTIAHLSQDCVTVR